MSTREIAELTGKQHAHVMRDFENVCDALELAYSGYLQKWIHPQNGQYYPEYALPKDLTTTLVSGYSIPMRHKIVTRWIELEAQQAPTRIPTSFREALLLAAEQQEYLTKKSEKVSDKPTMRIYPVAPLVPTTGQPVEASPPLHSGLTMQGWGCRQICTYTLPFERDRQTKGALWPPVVDRVWLVQAAASTR